MINSRCKIYFQIFLIVAALEPGHFFHVMRFEKWVTPGKRKYSLYINCDKLIRESVETNNKGQGVIRKRVTAFAQELKLEFNE